MYAGQKFEIRSCKNTGLSSLTSFYTCRIRAQPLQRTFAENLRVKRDAIAGPTGEVGTVFKQNGTAFVGGTCEDTSVFPAQASQHCCSKPQNVLPSDPRGDEIGIVLLSNIRTCGALNWNIARRS